MDNTTIYKKIFELKEKLPKIKKDAEGYNYTYATLGSIQDIIKEPLQELGLILINEVKDQKVITSIIDKETGEKISSEIFIGNITTKIHKDLYDKNGNLIGRSEEQVEIDPQGLGSAITYYRRYNLLALLDLEVEDDDGASVSPRAKAKVYSGGKTLDVMEYVNKVKSITDIKALEVLYAEFKSKNPSQKQDNWLIKELAHRKKELLSKK